MPLFVAVIVAKKGYYCQLSNGETEEFDYKADVHLSNCPLREVPQKKDRSKVVGDYLRGRCDGYNACIDEILGSN